MRILLQRLCRNCRVTYTRVVPICIVSIKTIDRRLMFHSSNTGASIIMRQVYLKTLISDYLMDH
jgi:hypothetical protein